MRYALPGETGQGAGDRRAREALARGSPSRSSSRRPTASTRCARSPVSTAPGAVDLAFAEARRPRGDLKGAVVANQLARLGGYPVVRRGRGRRSSRRTAVPPAVADRGCGWPRRATARRASTAITSSRAGHRPQLCAAARRACWTGSTGRGGHRAPSCTSRSTTTAYVACVADRSRATATQDGATQLIERRLRGRPAGRATESGGCR